MAVRSMTIGLGDLGEEPAMTGTIEEWKGFMVATGASPATIKVRTQTLATLVRQSGYHSPDQLTRQDVLRFLARDLQPWTRWTYYRCLTAWDRWAQEFDHTTDSIVRGIPTPRKPAPVARPLTDEQIRALLAAPLSCKARAYVVLALFAALRVSEVARVRGEHFDLTAGWLLIYGKGGTVKHVPIHSEVAELAATFPIDGLWFPSPADPNRPVRPLAVSATIKAAMLSVGIHGVPHQLRDSCATMLQRQSHDLVLTQNFLRHASSATTVKYIKISDAAFQQAARSISWDAA
jgi:integrase/recombinase XerD